MTDSKDKKTTAGKAKTAATKTTQALAKSALTASTLPTAADLKDRFKAGSIPLQTDFADLIDMANTGAQAAGQASGQSGAGQGLTINSGLLEVKAGNGIAVSASGVSVDPNTVLPRGIITMFSGTKVPDGWLLCDGTHDTPNLIDRFIMGGNVADAGGKSSTAFSGDKNKKYFSVTTSSDKVTVSISISATALTEKQMPEHRHTSGTAFYSDIALSNGSYRDTSRKDYRLDNNMDAYTFMAANWNARHLLATDNKQYSYYSYTSFTGGGESHTHTATASNDSHSHTADITPPYYILAFIMKS